MRTAEVRLRPWRLEDAGDVAVMIDDEHLRPWSAIPAIVRSVRCRRFQRRTRSENRSEAFARGSAYGRPIPISWCGGSRVQARPPWFSIAVGVPRAPYQSGSEALRRFSLVAPTAAIRQCGRCGQALTAVEVPDMLES